MVEVKGEGFSPVTKLITVVPGETELVGDKLRVNRKKRIFEPREYSSERKDNASKGMK